MKNQTKGLLYASFTALLWGFLAIALKVALNDLNPVTVVWFRFTVAFAILMILMLLFDRSFVKTFRKPPLILFLAAIFLGLNYYGFINGIDHTSPASAQVFIQIGPVTLALAGIFIFKERLTWKHIAGFLMLVAGFTIFYSQQVNGRFFGDENFARGMVSVILGGLCWAVFSSLQKVLVRTYNPNHLNLFIYGLAAILFLPFADFSTFRELTLGNWLLLIFLGVNTLLAYGSLALALKYAEANKISVIITMNPIITFITMAFLEASAVSWIAHENFTLPSLAGAAVVFGGAVLVITSKRK